MEVVAIISIVSVLAWFVLAYKNANSQNTFTDDDTEQEK